jgi:hypothetical protein
MHNSKRARIRKAAAASAVTLGLTVGVTLSGGTVAQADEPWTIADGVLYTSQDDCLAHARQYREDWDIYIRDYKCTGAGNAWIILVVRGPAVP